MEPLGRLVVPGHVAFRHFETETVLINLRTGEYHGLNQTAAAMFDALVDRGTVDAAAAGVNGDAEQVTRDLILVRDGLLERGLIEYAGTDSEGDEPVVAER